MIETMPLSVSYTSWPKYSTLPATSQFTGRAENFVMDPLGICANITTLATIVFQAIKLLEAMKQGGNERLCLTTEVNSLWLVLKNIETQLELIKLDEGPWINNLRALQRENGVFEQIQSAV